jgi:CAAX protease family protein
LAIFFTLSYLIAWSTLAVGTFLPLGPLVSAVVVLIAEGVPGLARLGQRLVRWRVNWIWYAAAMGLPLLVHLMAVCLNMAAGAPAPSLTEFQPWYAVLSLFGSGW